MIQKIFLVVLLAVMAYSADTNISKKKSGKKVYPRGTIATH